MSSITYNEAIALGEILRMAQTNAKVAWIVDGRSEPEYGICRYVQMGDEGDTDNILTWELRITTRTGWERFVPIRQLITELNTIFTPYDWN